MYNKMNCNRGSSKLGSMMRAFCMILVTVLALSTTGTTGTTTTTTKPGATTRPPCSSTSCLRPAQDKFMNISEVTTYLDAVSNDPNGKVNMVTLTSGLKVLNARPYARKNMANARHWPDRPVFWIETGIEANNFLAVSVALNFIDYLVNSCTKYCLYDYYVIPLINEDGYNYARTTNSSWVKTREDDGSGCNGVNLLENFEHGDWASGDSSACSDLYKGASVMSSMSTQYQMEKASKQQNIKFSLTLTKTGNKLSYPHAYNKGGDGVYIPEFREYETYLDEYGIAASNSPSGAEYVMGSYVENHGVNHGHPLDFNYNQYGHSFNIALDGDETNIVAKTEEFIAGLHAMITHAKKKQGF